MMKTNRHSTKVGLNLNKFSSDSGLERFPLNKDSEEDSKLTSESNINPEKLQRENAKLKMQFEELRAQYQQLLEEGREETFEERRVNLLKAQVMQLERQVVLLSEGLSSQVCRCQDVEKAVDPLVDRLRSLLCSESSDAEVSIARSELTQLIEKCVDVRQKLHRTNKVTTVEDLSMPWVLTKSNIVKQPVTLLDLCYGKTNNLNLQQVSALESRLSQLFKHLHGMRQTLSLILAPGAEPPDQARIPPAPSAVYARLLNQAGRCGAALDRCCLDLLTLSLIVPSAPWASAKQQVSQELQAENILAVLPAFPRGAPQQRARRAAEALSRATNYSQLMAKQQVEALQAELEFHRGLYSLQVRYTEELIQGVRQAYQGFQENVSQSLCAPLQDVLSCYEGLRSTASEAALRDFLTAFKNNSLQIQEAVEALSPSKSQGDEALSRYGRDFLQSVEGLLSDCAEQRERAAGELQALREEYDQAVEMLRRLKVERRERAPAQDSALPEGAEQGGPGASRARGEPPNTTAARQTSLTQPKQSVLRKALSLDVASGVSRHGPSAQPGVTPRPARNEPGGSPPRRASAKTKVVLG